MFKNSKFALQADHLFKKLHTNEKIYNNTLFDAYGTNVICSGFHIYNG
jgi:hypothetical protein